MKVKMHIFHYRCGACGKTYDAPELSGHYYGMFLLRSKPSGHMFILNALEDTAYQELENIILNISDFSDARDLALTDLIQIAFTITCDVTQDHEHLFLNAKPACSHCKSDLAEYWEASDPPIFLEYELPKPTHQSWNTFSADKKKELIKSYLLKQRR